MYLKHDNLVIREATKQDAELLVEWWNDGRIMAHAGFPEGLHTTIEKVEKEFDSLPIYRLILEDNGVAIGEANYRMKSEDIAEIGIKICVETKQNYGRGKIYLSLLIKHLFNEVHVSKIILDTNLKNQRAQAVYEKLGFNKIAVRKDSWKDQLGNLQSIVDYELEEKDFNSFLT